MTASAETTFASRRASDTRLIGSVSAAHFVSHYYILALPPLFAFVRADYNVSYTEVGLALTVFNVASALLQTPTGFLVDRINARLVLVGGLLLGAVGLTIAAAVDSYWMLVAMFGLMGIGNTVYHPADYALLSRHISNARMSQAYSIHTFAGLAGTAAAPASLLYLHSLFGWRGAFVAAAILGFVVAAALLIFPHDESVPERPAKARDAAPADTSWRLLLSTPILVSFLFFTLLSFGNFGLQNFFVVALGTLHGTSAATANAALSGNLVLSAIGVLAGGWLAARTSRHGLAAASGLLLMASGAVLIALFDLQAAMLIAVMSAMGFVTGAIMPARDMLVREVTPPGAFGKVFGFVTNGFSVGGILSPLVFGLLMDRGEPRWVFLGIALIGACGILTVASVPRRKAG